MIKQQCILAIRYLAIYFGYIHGMRVNSNPANGLTRFPFHCTSNPIPKGKESGVGSAIGIGIMIIFFTRNFWFPSDNNSFYFAIGFGLASGVTSSITSYGQKIIKRRR